jgi:hypothetical protein
MRASSDAQGSDVSRGGAIKLSERKKIQGQSVCWASMTP